MITADVGSLLQARFGAGARVLGGERLAGDASERRFTRLSVGGTALPESVVLMEAPPVPPGQVDAFLAVGDHLRRNNVAVPELYAGDSARGLYLLEDCGDLHLAGAIQGATEGRIEDLYRTALDELLKIHLDASRPAPGDVPAPCFSLAFDEAKLMWELDFFLEHAVERLFRRSLSPASREEIRGEFRWLCRALAAQPRVLCHRDFHSRNLMVQGKRLRTLDYQDARMGPVAYDLASLLRDSYVCLPEGLVEAALAYYRESIRRAGGQAPGTDQFRLIFDWMSVQRSLKAVGTFAFQMVGRGRPGYLGYIAPTLDRVRVTLARYACFRRLRQALGRAVSELA